MNRPESLFQFASYEVAVATAVTRQFTLAEVGAPADPRIMPLLRVLAEARRRQREEFNGYIVAHENSDGFTFTPSLRVAEETYDATAILSVCYMSEGAEYTHVPTRN